jgi:acetylglutamate kinase
MNAITVVKLGGSTLGQHDTSLDDIATLHKEGHRFIVVHGGGSTISEWLSRLGVESRFVQGLRVTDRATLDVVVAVLAGLVNKQLVAELAARGCGVIGLSGADGGLIQGRPYDEELGFVGEVIAVDAGALKTMTESGAVVVLAPIAIEVGHGATPGTAEFRSQLLNINADTAAGQIAAAVQARRLVFLTDVPGVLDAAGKLIGTLTADQAHELIGSGTASGGMLPKLQAAFTAASGGVETVIVDGRESGALRAALQREVAGTKIA